MQIVVLNALEEVFVLNKYRLKFSKSGKMIYIGHLDLLKFFIRLIKRTQLPIAYSNGFNPHQQLTFAIPLHGRQVRENIWISSLQLLWIVKK